jgi:hypothetical protein
MMRGVADAAASQAIAIVVSVAAVGAIAGFLLGVYVGAKL